jgi:hypothetical protein
VSKPTSFLLWYYSEREIIAIAALDSVAPLRSAAGPWIGIAVADLKVRWDAAAYAKESDRSVICDP